MTLRGKMPPVQLQLLIDPVHKFFQPLPCALVLPRHDIQRRQIFRVIRHLCNVHIVSDGCGSDFNQALDTFCTVSIKIRAENVSPERVVNEDDGDSRVGFDNFVDFKGAEFEPTLWKDIVTVLLVLGNVETVGGDCVGFSW